jgi:hypothetical protein
VVWNAWWDLGETDNASVQLRLTPSDTLTGTSSETNAFQVDNTGLAGELTDFAAALDEEDVVLSWGIPATPSLHRVVIVRNEGDFPADPGDGVTVYDSADTGFYFDNRYLEGAPTFIRQDSIIDFAWGNGSPDGSIPVNYFSARWTVTVDVNATGPYDFHTLTEDGVRLFVDGEQIIDRWVGQPATEYCGYKYLGTGRHRVVMEYHHNVGNAEAHLYLTGPGLPRGAVPVLAGHPLTFTDFGASPATTYYYAGFTCTEGGSFSTGTNGARAVITTP